VLVIGGDYNVAPEAIDIYAPKDLDGTICYHQKERKSFRALLNCGVIDAYRTLHPTKQEFSWWDYRGGSWQQNKGMRIDHLLLSPEASEHLNDCYVEKELRGKEKPSDHTPVTCKLNLQARP
jgi:exodeoxyribonuclease-3